MCAYYDGTKLLSLQDLQGKKPELFMCTTNRTGGKTTYFSRLCVNRWFDRGEQFGLLYRYKYELEDVSNKFFSDIKGLFFNGHEMSSRLVAKGIYTELRLDDIICGYALALNCADQIKKYAHVFNKVDRLYMDEFQSETNNYCPNEIKKFLSVHTSIARGQGKQKRYVPVYMTANPVTLINPYYTALKISSRLNDNTKFLRGNGFVLEQGFVESASEAQKESGIYRAFASDEYVAYSSEAVYLNDNKSFIEKPVGKSKYVCTLKYANRYYAIREFPELGIVYCDDRVDNSFPYKITVTTDDHEINYVMLKTHDIFLMNMRYYFEKGCFRFKDLACKEAVLATLSY